MEISVFLCVITMSKGGQARTMSNFDYEYGCVFDYGEKCIFFVTIRARWVRTMTKSDYNPIINEHGEKYIFLCDNMI